MEQPQQFMPMTKDEFWKVYWFSPLQMVTLTNPKPYDYKFMVEMRNFIIRSGAKEPLPGTVANVYLSQMTRIMAQDDNKMEFLSDFALMRQYYDKLIINVKSLVSEYNPQPAYLSNVPEHMRVQDEPETPPWESATKSSMSETNSQMKNTVEDPKKTAKPTEKEFEHDGSNYKMVVDKNGRSMFYVDGRRITEDVYSKAASML